MGIGRETFNGCFLLNLSFQQDFWSHKLWKGKERNSCHW